MDATFDRLDQIAIAVCKSHLRPTVRHCFPRWTTRSPKRLPSWARNGQLAWLSGGSTAGIHKNLIKQTRRMAMQI